ncbi:hypothetical protein ACI2LJ_19835 [Streptomyces sp. NPDC088090]|uniref:hypothetical protein n=1 Tax=Streptomyces sp. NPDC088090 TaxID=3365822 RepID=UPI00384E5A62
MTNGKWYLLAAIAGLTAATLWLISLFPVYSYAGASETATHLNDHTQNVAFNSAFIAGSFLSAILALPRVTRKFGAAMLLSIAALSAAETFSDAANFLRSDIAGTSGYYTPGPGYWCSLTGTALHLIACGLSFTALKRDGAFKISLNQASAIWATLGVLAGGAWLLGEWIPWRRTTFTGTVEGKEITNTITECCNLSEMPGQYLTEALLSAAILAATALTAATLRSAPAASGLLLGASVSIVADIASALTIKAPSLADVASAWSTTEEQLRQIQAFTETHHLNGFWIALASAVTLILMATARGFMGSRAT